MANVDSPDFLGQPTFGSQVELTNSPHTFMGSPSNQAFPIPANTQGIDGLLIVPIPSALGYVGGQISVVGANTGAVYLNTTAIGSNPFICDFSSVADPGGVVVNYTHFGGGGTGTGIHVIGLDHSQLVRPVHGGLAEGPNLVASANASNGGSSTLFTVPNNGQYRVWAITVAVFGATLGNSATIQFGGVAVLAAYVSANGTGNAVLELEGGYPITSGGTVAVATGGASETAFGSVFYSVDA